MKRSVFIPYLLFLAAFAVALAGLNPTFYADDSAETVTSGVLLGIPHPPGYPFHTMLTRLALLLPVSHFPFRGSLLSALLAAGVVALLYRLLRQTADLASPLAAAFSFLWIAGTTAYPAALSAKGGIYHLTALLVAGTVFALLKRRLMLAAFLLGLGFGNHWMSMVAYVPGFILLGWAVIREEPPEPREFPRMGAFLLAGLSVYLFLPLRAVLQPDLNWGDPQTWERFKFNFLRTQYSGEEASGSFRTWVDQGWHFLKTGFFEYPGLLAAAAAGVWAAFRADRRRAGGLLLSWAGLMAAVVLYLNLKPDRYHLIEAYALSSHFFILVFAGLAAARFVQAAPEGPDARFGRRERSVLALTLVLALLVPSLFDRVVKRRQDRYTFSYDYCLNVWRGIPRGSIFFARGDSIIFPGWYFQWVEARRTDLAVIGVDGLPMRWVREVLKRMHPWLRVPFPEEQVPFVGAESIGPMTRFLFYANPGPGKYFSYNKITDGSFPEVRLVPDGLAYRGALVPEGAPSPPVDRGRVMGLWSSMRLRNLADHGASQDERTRKYMLKDYSVIRNGLGVYYEDQADALKAASAKAGRPVPAEELERLYQGCYENFLWSSEWFPDDHEYAFNVGNALFNLGHIAESTRWYEKAVKLEPRFVNAYFNWGVAEYQMAQYQKAGGLFEQVLARDAEIQGPDGKMRNDRNGNPFPKTDPALIKQAEGALQYMKFQGWYRIRQP